MAIKFDHPNRGFDAKKQAQFLIEKLEAVAPGEFKIRDDKLQVVLAADPRVAVTMRTASASASFYTNRLSRVVVEWGADDYRRDFVRTQGKRRAWQTDIGYDGSFDVKKTVARARAGIEVLKTADVLEQAAVKKVKEDRNSEVDNKAKLAALLDGAGLKEESGAVRLPNDIQVSIWVDAAGVYIKSVAVPFMRGTVDESGPKIVEFLRQLAAIKVEA